MTVGWRDRKGKKVYDSERQRVTRRFRYHVNTKHNPRGRIYRMLCAFCPVNSQKTISQAHHINYKHPFVVVWVCESCHRRVESGSLEITLSKICDYTALVAPILRPATSAAARAFHKEIKAATPF